MTKKINKLQLKGKNVKNLKPEQKKKMEDTLERMDKTREEDTKRLRHIIQDKIKIHEVEVEKAITFIKQMQVMKLKNEGAIISLKEILNQRE